MIYAEILAGGKGSRMGNVEMPKQFLKLRGKPILIHTIEQFKKNRRLDKIIITAPREWMLHTRDIVKKWIGKGGTEIIIVEGGQDRNESIMSGIRYIEKTFGLQDDDIIVTHDAVRPFLTQRIIDEHVDEALKHGAVDTAIAATDNILGSDKEGKFVERFPVPERMFQGQTPQSFNIKQLVELYDGLTETERSTMSEACRIFALNGRKVKIVLGETSNIKITTPYDLKIAESLLKNEIVAQ